MAWTTPVTQTPDTLVTNTIWNRDLTENLIALASRPLASINYSQPALYSLTGTTSWTDVDSVNLGGTISTASGTRLLFIVQCRLQCTGAQYTHYSALSIAVDGTRIGNTNQGMGCIFASNSSLMTVFGVATGLTAGSHAFKLQYRTSHASNTAIIGNNTVNGYEPHLVTIFVLEV